MSIIVILIHGYIIKEINIYGKFKNRIKTQNY